MSAVVASSVASITSSALGSQLQDILMSDDIEPGSAPSYELCKLLYVAHPLGAKMVDSPISMAQSQPRQIAAPDAPPEAIKAFQDEWLALDADKNIANTLSISRIYGIGSIVLGCEEVSSDKPIDMDEIWHLSIFFNVLDPLNTAGSLVLNQVPTSPDFNKPATVSTNGQQYHRSRYEVVMNEKPIYLAYTSSAFGFVGRSVYQRALFPLKSFIRSMIADDMIQTKLGVIVAKQKATGSVVNKMMEAVTRIKRALLKEAQTGQVLSIDTAEDITTLNMQNVDGAGSYSRTNILKNVATAADMPAKLLENETLVAGFGEGTEDAKSIAGYIEVIRKVMEPLYRWFTNICQYRAWSPQFYRYIQSKYPEEYGEVPYKEAFYRWRQSFSATWPSLLREPESELAKVEKVKLEGIISLAQVILPELGPDDRARLIQWVADSVSEMKRLFPRDLILDFEAIADWQKTVEEQGGGDEDGDDAEGDGAETEDKDDPKPGKERGALQLRMHKDSAAAAALMPFLRRMERRQRPPVTAFSGR